MVALKKIVFLGIILFVNLNVYSQKDLRDESHFLYSKIDEYKEWLDSKGFSSVLAFDSLQINENRVKVYLGYSQLNPKDFELNLAWEKLKEKYEKNSRILLEEYLFNNLFFTLEISPDSLDLIVLGTDRHLFEVTIFGSEYGVSIADKIARARDPEKIPIPVIDLKTKYVEQKDKVKSPNLNNITSEVKAFLQNYYKEKGAWWYFAEIEVVKDFQHDLIIEITDLKGEILHNERQYFEYIRIAIKAEKQGKDVVLTYDLMAKYGSGIFLAPRSVNDYKNMDIKYPNSLENYKEKIKSLIHKQLTK